MIGVLDIYGFEIFRVCLQTASETLHKHSCTTDGNWSLNVSPPLHLKCTTTRHLIKVSRSLARNTNKVAVCGFSMFVLSSMLLLLLLLFFFCFEGVG